MLGFGATARALAKLLKGFDVTILAYDPFAKIDPEFAKETKTSLVTLDDVISRSDVISLHMPATPETTKVINSERLSKMRSHAVIVNVGRGELIDEVALEEALSSQAIAGAALDVREIEPPKDSRFRDLSNVILTPHIAGITQESQAKINEVLVDEVRSALTGGSPSYAVGGVKEFKK